MEHKEQLPNANTALILGILSIVTSVCYGIVGLTLGIIALVISKKDLQLIRDYPDKYQGAQSLRAGRTCAIVGICIAGLVMLLFILYFVFVASVLLPIAVNA